MSRSLRWGALRKTVASAGAPHRRVWGRSFFVGFLFPLGLRIVFKMHEVSGGALAQHAAVESAGGCVAGRWLAPFVAVFGSLGRGSRFCKTRDFLGGALARRAVESADVVHGCRGRTFSRAFCCGLCFPWVWASFFLAHGFPRTTLAQRVSESAGVLLHCVGGR